MQIIDTDAANIRLLLLSQKLSLLFINILRSGVSSKYLSMSI